VDDYVLLGGLRFTAKAVESIPNQQFSQAGADVIDAESLRNVINDHRTQAKILLAHNGYTVTARRVGNRVDLYANLPGANGEFTLTTSTAVRLPVLAPDYVSGAYRPFRMFMDEGILHASALNGALSKMKAATYVWLNPAFTYGPAATDTAFKVNGTTHILATGVGPAVTIYDASGNVI
jgi:hypothetical protein